MAPGSGIEPSPRWWEASALTTVVISASLSRHIYIMSSNERDIVRNDKYTRFNQVKMH